MPFKKYLSELQGRLDWISTHVTRKTGADTNKQNPNGPIVEFGTNRIFIEIYTATKNAKGEIVYTYSKDVHAPDSKMLQLFGMVQNPYTTEAEGAIPAMVYNDVPKGNLNWSKTLYSPEPKVAVTKEIPDWTDGKVVEMIAEYKKRCAEGMTGTEAQQRKKQMLEEIEAHQGNLVKELETIHHEMGDREDTEILLAIWRKKMETWGNEVSSLGEGCIAAENPSGETVNIDDLVQKFISFCNKKLLPASAASFVQAEIQKLLNQEAAEIARVEKEKQDSLAPYSADELKDATIQANILRYDEVLNTLNESHKKNLDRKSIVDKKAAEGKCYETIEIEVDFEGNNNTITKIDEKKLGDIAEVMIAFPTTTLTITGYHGQGLEGNRNNYDIETDSTDYDPTDKNSLGGVEKTTGDVAMLRAEAIKKRLKVSNPENITCIAGKEAISQYATLKLL